jgi:hypothetical protein
MPMQVKKNFVIFPATGAPFKAISRANCSVATKDDLLIITEIFQWIARSAAKMSAFQLNENHPARRRTTRSSDPGTL